MSTLDTLRDLVARASYKAGWRLRFDPDFDRGQDSRGPTLIITIDVPDSYAPEKSFLVNHLMIVPDASYNERSWRRWLFEQILLVEKHEAMEFFKIDDARPYAPNHGPGNDPYYVFELGTLEDAQESFRGEAQPGLKV